MPPRRGNTYGRPKNFKGTMGRLIRDFKTQKWTILVVILLTVASGVISVINPVILGDTLNSMADVIEINPSTGLINIDWPDVYRAFGLMLGLYTATAILSWLATFIIEKVVHIWVYEQRARVKEKLDRLPLKYFDANQAGEILSRGTNDIDNIGRNFATVSTSVTSSITILIGGIIAMFVTNWILTLVVLAMFPLLMAIVLFLAKRSRKQFKVYRKKYGNLESIIEEDYSGYMVLKLFGHEEDAVAKFDEINEDMTEADRKSQWISGFIFPTMRFMYNLGFVAVSVVAGITQGTGIGDLVAFIIFLNLVGSPFQQLGQMASTIESMAAAGERTYALLDEQEQSPDAKDAITDVSKVQVKIDFEHVVFSYTEDKPLFTDINLNVKPGEMVAIVGPTGAGKTTIVNLLMRFYEINAGSIKLDDVDIRNYSRSALRSLFGMVLQDTWLFAGSIRENIRYGRSDATDEEVIEAAKAARAHHFIKTLSGGYDFELNEDGTNISQGQRQLITIARALLSQPKIMILDEATSSVDTRTEKAIQDAMEQSLKNRTSFVIAHRLSTIKNAKTILVMNKGNIVEMGSHEELLAKNGFYADLYNAQFLGQNPMAKEGEIVS
ncbi:MAG: ABC transporter ATP-binding protein [Bacilli bacterium]|nr:ABC transporter ATP-binding protein [Bacilli bacterium]